MREITFLVADDNDDDVWLLTEAFRIIGTSPQIVRAGDGQKALDLLWNARQPYDLILLDYFLPRLNAPEILQQAGSSVKAPVVVLSSHLDPQEEGELRNLGVALFAEKPNNLEGLCNVARKMLELLKS